MIIGLDIYPTLFWILIKLEFSCQILKKSSNIGFHENPSSGSRVDPWGQTGELIDEQT
jgi:hypothetical protein